LGESAGKKRTTIYIDEPIINEFQKICQREGKKISTKLEDLMLRYNVAHGEGNPQLRLERFTGELQGKTCFLCQGRFPTLKKVEFISGLKAQVCNNCFEAKSKPPYRTVKRVLGVVA
jgi:hypothetical protein